MTAPLRYLSADDVSASMPPLPQVQEIVESALRAHAAGRTQLPPKVDLVLGDDAFCHAMPALVEQGAGRACGVKWIAGNPANRARGLPQVNGLLVLNDAETGVPVAILDAAQITAARTGACTAVTAKHFAKPDSEVLAILGCGVQGKANLEALLAAFPGTERMLAFDTSTEAQNAFADYVMQTHDVASVIPQDPAECVEGADIVVTSGAITRAPEPTIEWDWLQTGTLCVALDFDAYFKPEVFERADRFVTDDLAQFDAYVEAGYFAGVRRPDSDLPGVLAGTAPGRPDGEPVVVAANLGLGLLDVALGAAVLERAVADGRGTRLG